jgi:hypothetical protein
MWAWSKAMTTTGPRASPPRLAPGRPQGRGQARDAEREARGRGLLAGEPRHQVVIAPAAADRAERRLAPFSSSGRQQQLGLEHRAGVVFQPPHDRRLKQRLVVGDAQALQGRVDRASSFQPLVALGRAADDIGDLGQGLRTAARAGLDEVQHRVDRLAHQARALGEGAALVQAALAQQQAHALDAQAVQLVDGAQHAQLLAVGLDARPRSAGRSAACGC